MLNEQEYYKFKNIMKKALNESLEDDLRMLDFDEDFDKKKIKRDVDDAIEEVDDNTPEGQRGTGKGDRNMNYGVLDTIGNSYNDKAWALGSDKFKHPTRPGIKVDSKMRQNVGNRSDGPRQNKRLTYSRAGGLQVDEQTQQLLNNFARSLNSLNSLKDNKDVVRLIKKLRSTEPDKATMAKYIGIIREIDPGLGITRFDDPDLGSSPADKFDIMVARLTYATAWILKRINNIRRKSGKEELTVEQKKNLGRKILHDSFNGVDGQVINDANAAPGARYNKSGYVGEAKETKLNPEELANELLDKILDDENV